MEKFAETSRPAGMGLRSAARGRNGSRRRSGPGLPFLRAVLCLALVLTCAAGLSGCKGKGGRSGGSNLILLDKAFQPLRRDFESDAGKVRVVGVVAPTCGDCLISVETITTQLLSRIPSEDLEVYFLWASIASGDVTPRAEYCADKYADPRARHYWDDSGRIARAFAAQMGLESGRSIYNVFFVYGKNDTWDPEAKMLDEPPGQNALLAGWMPASPRARMGENLQIRMPGFDVNALTRMCEQLLAEPFVQQGGAKR